MKMPSALHTHAYYDVAQDCCMMQGEWANQVHEPTVLCLQSWQAPPGCRAGL